MKVGWWILLDLKMRMFNHRQYTRGFLFRRQSWHIKIFWGYWKFLRKLISWLRFNETKILDKWSTSSFSLQVWSWKKVTFHIEFYYVSLNTIVWQLWIWGKVNLKGHKSKVHLMLKNLAKCILLKSKYANKFSNYFK